MRTPQDWSIDGQGGLAVRLESLAAISAIAAAVLIYLFDDVQKYCFQTLYK